MSGHRRSRRSPNASSSCSRNNSCYLTSTSTSTKDEEERDVHIHHRRRFKRPFTSSTLGSRPGWVILNQCGARRDGFHSDDTSSATSFTSNGEQISVSFELVKPPGISVLCLDCPKGPSPSTSSCPEVIAAHREVVLFKMYSRSYTLVNYFVYQATSDASQLPSLLLLLPTARYAADDDDEETSYGRRRGGKEVLMSRKDTGIISCRNKEDSSLFVVANLEIMTLMHGGSRPEIEAHLFRCGADEWKVFKNLQVNGANGGGHLQWWTTDTVMPYQDSFLMWVDYYQGMILTDMSSQLEGKDDAAPRLWYVPFPVDKITENPDYNDRERGFLQGSRCVCATRDGMKFVCIDHRLTSDWGVGHRDMMEWNRTFRITTWSLREHDYAWRKDGMIYEEEFWDVLSSGNHLFPRVTPEYPVVNMDNPDIVCFRLKKINSCEPTWMIEVDMKKKVLLAATSYSMETSSDGKVGTINYARVTSYDLPLCSDLPRYLNNGRDCKKRRQ